MIVAKLSISYDRGTSYNKPSDIGANVKRNDVLADGGVVRGLGSHFRSQEAAEASRARDKEARRVYQEFRERFMVTDIDGLFIVPDYGVADAFVKSLDPRGIEVRVSEREMFSSRGLDKEELVGWGAKVRRQLVSVGLGRKKELDQAGVRAVLALADCPLLTSKTRDAVKNLVSLLENKQLNRAGFREKLESLDIAVQQIDAAHDARKAEAARGLAWADEHVPTEAAGA